MNPQSRPNSQKLPSRIQVSVTAVRVAIAWRYFAATEGEAAVALLRRIVAIL